MYSDHACLEASGQKKDLQGYFWAALSSYAHDSNT
jgi:hypothetical protein